MSDRTQPIAARLTPVSSLPQRLPRRLEPAAAWRARALDGLIRQGLLTVRCQPSDARAAEALGGLFFSRARLPRLPERHHHALRELVTSLRACLNPGADSAQWSRVTALIEALLDADGRPSAIL